ncbi:amidase signature domain-containing protein [Triangularia verruculosa]|uniref:Amidase signature domain-containing protein n=1 Tax=Triangularia verruculosa TaxID=2587418 RepID=A0AAN7AVR6_9PEZI|nr:amidase signature domain-containing protein [Triangularia verruculosa]
MGQMFPPAIARRPGLTFAANASISANSQVIFELDGRTFLALPIEQGRIHLPLPAFAREFSILSVFHAASPQDLQNASSQKNTWLWNQIKDWQNIDDVFSPEFLAGIVAVVSSEDPQGLDAAISLIPKDIQPSWWASVSGTVAEELDPGPYVVFGGILSRIYRLYDNVAGAFIVATKPLAAPGSDFQNLRVGGDFYSSIGVAVPSRLSATLAKKKPLQGLRFAIKDVFAVKGLRVTAGNRAFYTISVPAVATCPIVQRLIDAGADLVGTLKLGSLIAREEPTESVDFHAPFNPRGDGYQSAWSSSGGSGAAIASYDWLDFTLGTDTTGSSRRPALANGAFQIRLTHNTIPLDDVVPSFKRFDSGAMFTRDIVSMEKWVGAWIGQESTTYDALPISIIFLTDFLPISNEGQMDLIETFTRDLEATYNKSNPPEMSTTASVEDYLTDVGTNTFVYDVYHTMDEFRQEYRERFAREPYVNPVTKFRWDLAKTISTEEHEDAMGRLEVYKNWLLECILKPSKQNPLVILPITSQEVDYREDPPAQVFRVTFIFTLADRTRPPTAPNAFDGIWLAPVLGAPEVSVPIGELKYRSRITGNDEYLPAVVSVLGKPGSDMALLNAAIKVLKSSGRPLQVKTGTRMFES